METIRRVKSPKQKRDEARGDWAVQARDYWALLSDKGRHRIAHHLGSEVREPFDSYDVAMVGPGAMDLPSPVLPEVVKLARAYLRGAPKGDSQQIDDARVRFDAPRLKLFPDDQHLAGNRLRMTEAASSDLPTSTKALEGELEGRHAVSLSIHFSKNSNAIILSRIVVERENRGRGVGAAVMKELCSFADRRRVRIALTPSSDFGGTKARLVTFYKRFGFKPYKGFEFNETMVREPAPIMS